MTTAGWLVRLLDTLYRVYFFLLLARVLLSWFPRGWGPGYYRLLRLLGQLTDPVLSPVRRFLPPMGGLDFSPLVAMLLLGVVHRLLVTLVLSLSF